MHVFLFVCFAALSLASSGCAARGSVPAANEGVIDLSGWDFERNGNAILGGDWELYWKELLRPGDSRGFAEKKPSYANVPGSWNGRAGTDPGSGGDGYATYRLTVLLGRYEESLAIQLYDVATAYVLYVNGMEAASRGKVGTDERSSVPHKSPHSAAFSVRSDRMEIVMHVSNYHEKNGGIWYHAPVIGRIGSIAKKLELGLLLQGIVMGCMIVIGVFHLSMFLLRKYDLSSLAFFFFCAAICIRLPVMGDSFLLDRFFADSWEWIYRLQYVSFFLAVPLFNVYVYTIFKTEYSAAICRVLVGICTVFVCFGLFASPKFLSYALEYFDVLTNAYTLYLIVVIVRALAGRREGAVIFLAGYLVFGASVLNDILIHHHMLRTEFMLPVGLFVFVISQSLLLSLRFVNTFNRARAFSVELEDYSRNLEMKVAERTKRLEAATENTTRLYMGLAHDTRTPLMLIRNYLDTFAAKTGLGEELALIRDNFERLIENIDDYLDNGRIVDGLGMYDHGQAIDISTLLGEKVALFRETAASAGVTLDADVADGVRTRMDPYAFDRVVNNLLDNAVKFTDTGGSVRVSLRKLDSKAILAIEDTGIGMTETQVAHVFELFYRVEPGNRAIRGTGIGLNTVKGILEGVRGQIDMKSEPGKGTRATVILDACDEPEAMTVRIPCVPKKPRPAIADSVPDPARPTVFIVEDDDETASLVMDCVKKKYNAFRASNGREALVKIDRVPKPSIIVSDIVMRDMDGHEFYDRLVKRGRYADVPFVFLTAMTSKQEKLKSLGQGAIEFIAKPFDADELVARIDSIIGYAGKIREIHARKAAKRILKKMRERIAGDSVLNIEENCRRFKISKREREIIGLLMQGKVNKEICAELDLSGNTVRNHISNIYGKCDVQTRVELLNVLRKPLRRDGDDGRFPGGARNMRN